MQHTNVPWIEHRGQLIRTRPGIVARLPDRYKGIFPVRAVPHWSFHPAPQDRLRVGYVASKPIRNRPAPQRGHPRIYDCEPLNAIDPNGYKSLVDVLRYRRLTLLYTVTQVIHVEIDSRCPITA
jgi:hypothetical protein